MLPKSYNAPSSRDLPAVAVILDHSHPSKVSRNTVRIATIFILLLSICLAGVNYYKNRPTEIFINISVINPRLIKAPSSLGQLYQTLELARSNPGEPEEIVLFFETKAGEKDEEGEFTTVVTNSVLKKEIYYPENNTVQKEYQLSLKHPIPKKFLKRKIIRAYYHGDIAFT